MLWLVEVIVVTVASTPPVHRTIPTGHRCPVVPPATNAPHALNVGWMQGPDVPNSQAPHQAVVVVAVAVAVELAVVVTVAVGEVVRVVVGDVRQGSVPG